MDDKLRLVALDASDLQVISTLMQDMAVRAGDIGYDRCARRVALVGNRYRWERRLRTRVRAALRFDGVLSVERRNWPRLPATMLDLLSVTLDGEQVQIDFAGGASLRLTVEAIDAVLEDLSGAWGARLMPRHDI